MSKTLDLLDCVLKKLETIEKLLTGNGDPEKGIIVRLDRVEGAQNRHRYFLNAIFGILCTVVATLVGTVLMKYVSH